ncbi:MAG: ABC transporter ATP-binding protein [Lachnospiraceae bacterium]|nr:ABC transporter ATP-binding protein [Lachnospiraceae bacterium]
MNAIEMKNLTKTYGKNRGIHDITMSVEEGDIFGYLGPNGAGKSTSIRCLLGMITASCGQAYMLGTKVGRGQMAEILKRVGYMPSEAYFYPSMKAGEVIRYGAALRGMDCREEEERICRILEVDRNKKIRELSLGNRKKVSIVCALQHKPDLVILDEPTSGLDPLMQEAFFDLLMERNREGMTCFLSSHVLPEVKKYCRHVGILREGELVKVDTVENLTRTKLQALRKIKIYGTTRIPELEGVSQVVRWEDGIGFSYQGEMKILLRALQGLEVKDLLISEPSLEEVFIHFYG